MSRSEERLRLNRTGRAQGNRIFGSITGAQAGTNRQSQLALRFMF